MGRLRWAAWNACRIEEICRLINHATVKSSRQIVKFCQKSSKIFKVSPIIAIRNHRKLSINSKSKSFPIKIASRTFCGHKLLAIYFNLKSITEKLFVDDWRKQITMMMMKTRCGETITRVTNKKKSKQEFVTVNGDLSMPPKFVFAHPCDDDRRPQSRRCLNGSIVCWRSNDFDLHFPKIDA